ncbi:MAG: dTDP-4-dehydrorhamnose reductase [Chloroflexi bacterium 44-23]|nr:MAG: dTDP-4-dehydrorhamnose reductase [Chloroflexi bacterium 44-23]
MTPPKILLFGKNGQLGWEAERQLFCMGDLFAYDYPQIDFTDPKKVVALLDDIQPDFIYNAVAFTAVDQAESEISKATLINSTTPGEIAAWCKRNQRSLMHFSTDYVFDGYLGRDYREDDLPHPLNVYGQSKLAGEQAILQSECTALIFRTSWVYSMRGESFVIKFLSWARDKDELRVVDDQIGNPTWARMLAQLSSCILPINKEDFSAFFDQNGGLYHLAGGGAASRLQWSQEILDNLTHEANIKTKNLAGAKTYEFPAPACRPLHSALNCEKYESTFGRKIPHWKLGLRLALDELAG